MKLKKRTDGHGYTWAGVLVVTNVSLEKPDRLFTFVRDDAIMWVGGDENGQWWHLPWRSSNDPKFGPYTYEQAVALARLMS